MIHKYNITVDFPSQTMSAPSGKQCDDKINQKKNDQELDVQYVQ